MTPSHLSFFYTFFFDLFFSFNSQWVGGWEEFYEIYKLVGWLGGCWG